MSTHRAELFYLQEEARKAGRTVDFIFDGDGYIDAVFYRDPKASPASRSLAGYRTTPLAFAELERAKLAREKELAKGGPVARWQHDARRRRLAAEWNGVNTLLTTTL